MYHSHTVLPLSLEGLDAVVIWSVIGQGFIVSENMGGSALFILFFFIPMVSYHQSIQASSPTVSKHSVSIYYVLALCRVVGTQK